SFHSRAYRRCRAALERLITSEDLGSWPELLPEHVKGSTAVRQPNIPGSTEVRLSWIWHHDGSLSEEPASGTAEYKRVHWLRGRAESQRWAEEVVLLEHEMQWTVQSYLYDASRWDHLAIISASRPGSAAFAFRKAAEWRTLAATA
ncbi:hypothetical protein CPB83DRAFT_739943, partial [Crepidotus variabilis]